MASRKVEAVSDVLLRVVRTLEIEAKLLSHSVEPTWPRAVGARLAAHTRAISLRAGVLTVEARSAAWMNELSLMREQLRVLLNAALPGAPVRELRFRLGGGFAPLGGGPHKAVTEASEVEVEAARRELAAASASGPSGDGAELVARAFALSRKVPR